MKAKQIATVNIGRWKVDNTQPMQGRWLREATDKEIRMLTKNHSGEAIIVEWEWAGQTFWLFERHSTIVRTGAMGGDVIDIHGGWVYANPLMARLDWQEIEQLGKRRAIFN